MARRGKAYKDPQEARGMCCMRVQRIDDAPFRYAVTVRKEVTR
jgi:hypothetical protein